jgi:hypothetical protein
MLRGRKWHASQEFKDRPDGSLAVTMQLNNLEEGAQFRRTCDGD